MGINRANLPDRMLAWAVRRMPAERREWGVAMLAELAALRRPATRWRFALSCTRVALFPPRSGGFMRDYLKQSITTFGLAALGSLLFIMPLAWLEIRNYPPVARDWREFPIPLFIVLWLLPAVFIFTLAPLARTVRAGGNLLAQPVRLLLRVALLAFVATCWGWLVADQMPCFLGAPNCD